MKIDYIIVGCGLASIAFCEQLRLHNKSFVVIDDSSQKSSTVAAGLYNPVILKRFSEVWKAQEQLELALPYYSKLEEYLNVKLNYQFPIYRRFASIEEQNLWFQASDKPRLSPFLSTQLVKNNNKEINAPFGFGKVLQSGRIDTTTLVKFYKEYLKSINCYLVESFDYKQARDCDNRVSYKSIEASAIVFAEGFGLQQNPYFKKLPLNGTKGEVLTIKTQKLKSEMALKSSVFVIPIGNDLYKVGATYNWTDKSNAITNQAKEELIAKLKTLINCEFEIVNQQAGIRPTVNDRRPLVGPHPTNSNFYVLNGLGTRGVMIAPYVAKQLFNHIENGEALDDEIDIKRFTS